MNFTKMKAYELHDKYCYAPYNYIIFAETPGKAKFIGHYLDDYEDFDFVDLRVKRVKALDKYYKGNDYMDWMDMDDRIAMVKEANFECSIEVYNPDCKNCAALEFCYRGQDREKEEEVM